VSEFLRQAEDILDTAFQGDTDQDMVIVMDRQGGMRLLDPSGWTLPALSAEYGATAVYRVERRGGAIRVEGLAGAERCLLQRKAPTPKLWGIGMPGMPTYPAITAQAITSQAMMLHTSAWATV
jgi:hypothetical protein